MFIYKNKRNDYAGRREIYYFIKQIKMLMNLLKNIAGMNNKSGSVVVVNGILFPFWYNKIVVNQNKNQK